MIRKTHMETTRRQRAHRRTHRRGKKRYDYTEIRFGGLWLELAGWNVGDYAEREDHGNRIELTRVPPSKASANASKVTGKRESRSQRVYPSIRLIEGISDFLDPGEQYEIKIRGPGRLSLRKIDPAKAA